METSKEWPCLMQGVAPMMVIVGIVLFLPPLVLVGLVKLVQYLW
jgi:hypothetical protein